MPERTMLERAVYKKGMNGMKKILMITTGGTIASQQSDCGLYPQLTPQDLLSYVPEVSHYAKVETLEVCNIDSTNIRPHHWSLISHSIEENYTRYDGFVICHGTDTMAYTGAALSYMIQNVTKPIVITGAQRPIDMDVTDAKTNLLDSFVYAASEDSQGVVIVFDGKVIIGTRAKKVRAKSYNAFESFNFPYPAVIQDQYVIRYLPPETILGEPQFFHNMDANICTLKITPGMLPESLQAMYDLYDGIVIESFGVGGIPESITEEFHRLLSSSESDQKVFVMATQVANEGSNMSVYEVGQRIKQTFHLMEAFDMTFEATVTKLMWILSNQDEDHSMEDIRNLFYKKINYDILIHRS